MDFNFNSIKESTKENLDALRYLVEEKKDEAKHFIDLFVIDKIKFFVKDFFDKYLPCLSSLFEEGPKYTPPESSSSVNHYSFPSQSTSLVDNYDDDDYYDSLPPPKEAPPVTFDKNGAVITPF